MCLSMPFTILKKNTLLKSILIKATLKKTWYVDQLNNVTNCEPKYWHKFQPNDLLQMKWWKELYDISFIYLFILNLNKKILLQITT